MSMDALITEVLGQARTIARDVLKREGTRLRTATVEQASPLLIRYDGEEDASVVAPRTTVAAQPGNRVVVAKARGQATILGVLGGGGGAGTYSPRSAGARGNGTTDDTAAWGAFLAGLPAGAVVQCPLGDVYRTTGAITVPRAVTIRGARFKLDGAHVGLDVKGDDVTLEQVSVIGDSSTVASTQHSIQVSGKSGSPVRRFTCRDVEIRGSRYAGIWASWVDGFEITGGTIDDIQYAAIMILSSRGGYIAANRISNLVMGGSLDNSYGIAITDVENTVAGRSEDISVIGNTLRDIPWEGIDTHSGARIRFIGNTMERCGSGIAVLSGNTSRVVPVQDVVVADNTIIYASGNPQTQGALKFHGAQDAGRAPGSGTVTGNTIRGYTLGLHVWNVDRPSFNCAGNNRPEVGWTRVPLRSPGWQDGPEVLQYMVDGNAIHLRGAPNKDGNGTTSTTNTVGTLPEDYRPTDDRYLNYTWAKSGDNTGLYRLRSSGELQLLFESNPDSGGGYFPISASVSLI